MLFLYILSLLAIIFTGCIFLPGSLKNTGTFLYVLTLAILVFSVFSLMLRKRIRFFRTLSVYICVFLSIFIISEGIMIYYSGNTDANEQKSSILVPGDGMFVQSRITDELKVRLDKALEIYEKNLHLPIILSGGVDESRALPQCVAMKSYIEKQCREKNIPLPEIITDEVSLSLHDSLDFITNLNTSSYVVVNRFNLPRVKLICSRLSPDSVVCGVDGVYSKYPIYYVRELGLIIAEIIENGLRF